MGDNLVVTAFGISSTGNGVNLDNMYLNGRYINVPTDTMSRIQKTEDMPFQVYGVSDSEIGIGLDRSLGVETGARIMGMMQRTQNAMGGIGTISRERIWDTILETNRDLRARREQLGCDVLGSSFAALFLHGNRGLAVHLGDARIYVIRGGRMLQITDDHLESSDMFRLGILTQAQAEVHKSASRLTAYMGMDDIYESRDEAFSKFFVFYPGDTFILCTDGLSDAILNDEMERVTRLLKGATPDQIAVTMMDAANEHSIEDKTLVVLHVEEAPGEAPRRGIASLPRRENFEEKPGTAVPYQQPLQQRPIYNQPAAPQANAAPVPPQAPAMAAPAPAPAAPSMQATAPQQTLPAYPAPAPKEPMPLEQNFRPEPVQAPRHAQLSSINEPMPEDYDEDGAPSLLDKLLSDPKRLAIIIGAAIVALVLLIVVITAIAKGGKKNNDPAQGQQTQQSYNDSDSSAILPGGSSSVDSSEETGESSSEEGDASSEETSSEGTGSDNPAPGTPITEEISYEVKAGDTLYQIVLDYYDTGDISVIQNLATYNGFSINDGLSIGQVLKLPPLDQLKN